MLLICCNLVFLLLVLVLILMLGRMPEILSTEELLEMSLFSVHQSAAVEPEIVVVLQSLGMGGQVSMGGGTTPILLVYSP